MTMSAVDALTGTYRLGCPAAGSTTRVRLSSFRQIERLPGPAHPAVYRVVFACGCGGHHVGLVGHDALDWAPLGLDDHVAYVNLMTSRRDDLADELVDGRCPEHGTVPDIVEEENAFFHLSRYQQQLHDLISSDEIRIYPKERKNEVLRFIAAARAEESERPPPAADDATPRDARES